MNAADERHRRADRDLLRNSWLYETLAISIIVLNYTFWAGQDFLEGELAWGALKAGISLVWVRGLLLTWRTRRATLKRWEEDS